MFVGATPKEVQTHEVGGAENGFWQKRRRETYKSASRVAPSPHPQIKLKWATASSLHAWVPIYGGAILHVRATLREQYA
jgi:hypothetical protein